VIDGTYRLADIREALRRYGTGDHYGKVVIRMGSWADTLDGRQQRC
jgi:hypothetical protein